MRGRGSGRSQAAQGAYHMCCLGLRYVTLHGATGFGLLTKSDIEVISEQLARIHATANDVSLSTTFLLIVADWDKAQEFKTVCTAINSKAVAECLDISFRPGEIRKGSESTLAQTFWLDEKVCLTIFAYAENCLRNQCKDTHTSARHHATLSSTVECTST